MTERETAWTVVVDEEERRSIWPAHRAVPAGWRAVGEPGPRQACLDRIERDWTDMRPLRLRRSAATISGTRHVGAARPGAGR